ncbi:nucleotidyltransferase family protein [Jiulongibacter sp. NS-SX5]|uniref:nucleotidyltransferase family protein n=1 Tax=Jiulongibacter sp. NS-SX5 TaxID=3463854 RepID=UPI0040592DE0
MQPNKEVQFMLDLSKAYLFQMPLNKIESNEVNWTKLLKVQTLHSLNPLISLYSIQNTGELPKYLHDRLNTFLVNQATMNLILMKEWEILKKEFQKENIPIAAFKGIMLTESLFPDNIRASGDLDLFVSKNQLVSALMILTDLGYSSISHFSKEEIQIDKFQAISESKFIKEVTLIKNNIQIDLHWDFNYPVLPNQLPNDLLFNPEYSEEERLLFTILNHHGGKELWLRMKSLVDFSVLIMKKGSLINWEKNLAKMADFKLLLHFKTGIYLINKYLKTPIPEELKGHTLKELKTEEQIINYWNLGENWDMPLTRLRYERLFINSQDKKFSLTQYFLNYYHAFSAPNPLEPKRIYSLPENYTFLNFLGKIISYIFHRIRS